MPKLPFKTKEKAFNFRMRGFSIKEIAGKLKIAKSTASVWVRGIKLNKNAQKRLKKRNILSYYKTSLRWQVKRKKEEEFYNIKALKTVEKINKDLMHAKVYCALLYWCEGEKIYVKQRSIKFTNSDPFLIKTFLTFFRQSFTVDERKFRIMMHLHKYHNEDRQKKFWMKLTKIPLNKFLKTFFKLNTGKRTREDYPGCVSIYYYDCKIAKEIKSLYTIFSKHAGAW